MRKNKWHLTEDEKMVVKKYFRTKPRDLELFGQVKEIVERHRKLALKNAKRT